MTELILHCKTYHTFSVRTFRYFVGNAYLIGLEDNSQ